jgi:hypothetical protein
LVNGTSRRALGGMFLLKKVLEQNGTTFEVLTKAGIRLNACLYDFKLRSRDAIKE